MEEAQAGASAGRRVAGAALLLAASVLASRLLGFGRDVVLAGLVGAQRADRRLLAPASMLPDLLNHLLAGGALSIAFLPVYERIRKERGAAAGHRFTATALGTMGAVALAVTAALFVWARPARGLAVPASRPRCTRSRCGSRASCCPRSSASCAAASSAPR